MFGFVVILLQRGGIVGLGLLMLIENLVPVIPSELILPMAGFEAANGRLEPVGAAVLATLGAVIGGFAWYGVGRRIGLTWVYRVAGRHARWVTVSPRELAIAERWFRRWGGPAVCLGRTLPGIRGVICIPAGLAGMPAWAFAAWSTLGASIWTGLMMAAGYALKARYAEVQHWLNPVADCVLVLSLATYLIRVATYRPPPTNDPDA